MSRSVSERPKTAFRMHPTLLISTLIDTRNSGSQHYFAFKRKIGRCDPAFQQPASLLSLKLA